MRTWVHGADESGFGLENLPYGIVRRAGEPPRPAVRIGEYALELTHVLDGDAFTAQTLNPFLALGPTAWVDARRRIRSLLTDRAAAEAWLVPLSTLEVQLPIAPRDFVDFSTSEHHVTTVGKRFRPDAPLPPAYHHLPIAYHGRAGSVVVSGTPIERPSGLLGPGTFGPEPQLDFELELGIVTGDHHPFGAVLLNDWSARAIQRFEYVPLGPFAGKSFATSISPWVVPLDALAVADPPEREVADYLTTTWTLDVEVEVEVNGELVARSNARDLHWTVEQMVAQVTVNGARLAAGDLLGTGTISSPDNPGCRLETDGPYLADGDEVVLRGRSGAVSLGECRGVINAPVPSAS